MVGGAERRALVREPVGADCQTMEERIGESLDLGFLGREESRPGTLSSFGHQRVSGKGATGAAWLWIFPAVFRQSGRWFKNRSVRWRRAR